MKVSMRFWKSETQSLQANESLDSFLPFAAVRHWGQIRAGRRLTPADFVGV